MLRITNIINVFNFFLVHYFHGVHSKQVYNMSRNVRERTCASKEILCQPAYLHSLIKIFSSQGCKHFKEPLTELSASGAVL